MYTTRAHMKKSPSLCDCFAGIRAQIDSQTLNTIRILQPNPKYNPNKVQRCKPKYAQTKPNLNKTSHFNALPSSMDIHIYLDIIRFFNSRKEAAVPFEVCCLNGSGGRHRSCWRHSDAAGHCRGGEGKAAAVDGWRWETQRSGWDGFLHCILFFVSSRCLNDFLLCPARDRKISRWTKVALADEEGARRLGAGSSVVVVQWLAFKLFRFCCLSFFVSLLPMISWGRRDFYIQILGHYETKGLLKEQRLQVNIVTVAVWLVMHEPRVPPLTLLSYFRPGYPAGKVRSDREKSFPLEATSKYKISAVAKGIDWIDYDYSILLPSLNIDMKNRPWGELRKHTSKWSESLSKSITDDQVFYIPLTAHVVPCCKHCCIAAHGQVLRAGLTLELEKAQVRRATVRARKAVSKEHFTWPHFAKRNIMLVLKTQNSRSNNPCPTLLPGEHGSRSNSHFELHCWSALGWGTVGKRSQLLGKRSGDDHTTSYDHDG